MAQQRTSPTAAYTYADYLTWPEDERWEIIDGEAFDMTPAPGLDHQEILAELITQFRTFLRGKTCKVFPEPDVILPRGNESDAEARSVLRPDLAVVCDPAKTDDKRIRGAPDLVIEILSPSTASHDMIRKRRLYEQAGVREFWLVHPADRIVTIFRLESDGNFGKPVYLGAEDRIDANLFSGLTIDLTLVFPPRPRIVREAPRPWGSEPK
ncbi:Uma2 family endonuclease [Candidatus Ozemobacteraceae bacterium]|nr:Uma2 family endonuclease [Candidatus Ozemobacteraceae bacterium]